MSKGSILSKQGVALQSHIYCGLCCHFNPSTNSCPCFDHVEAGSYACDHFQKGNRKLFINVPPKQKRETELKGIDDVGVEQTEG